MAIKWVDRVATHPGRVQLTPVVGQTNIYDMERADEPTVAGTPINAANLNAMLQDAPLDASKTVYVAVSGSDSTGNGTSTQPYATIFKALSEIPQNLNGHSATINIAAGTYNENVAIYGYHGGSLYLKSASNTARVTINSLQASDVASLRIQDITLVITGAAGGSGISLTNSLLISDGAIELTGANAYGIYANRNSSVQITQVTVSNTTGMCVVSNGCSMVFMGSISGSNNSGIGVGALSGSILSYEQNLLTAPTKFYTYSGGRIFSGSQTSIPNY